MMSIPPTCKRLIAPPLSLYVHIPWCVRKCPYCDFNSHEAGRKIPIADYLVALKQDLNADKWMAQGRKVETIFFGGGTPSLMPNRAIGEIIDFIDTTIGIEHGAEITLEANPGTLEHHDFAELKATSVNRLSFGVQSFAAGQLAQLGRIHGADEARGAISRAQQAGFGNINIDLMHGLPGQTTAAALDDIHQAQALEPTHLSWYQLTIERNTAFYSHPPTLPPEEVMLDIQHQGQRLLHAYNYEQYEVSAYSRPGSACKHNLNYWQFGDYLAIGAGAHGKITLVDEERILRYRKTRIPQDYLDRSKDFTAGCEDIPRANLTLEFMMNALRLNAGVSLDSFSSRTGQASSILRKTLAQLKRKELIADIPERIAPSPLGRQFLNNLLEEFMP